MHTFLFFPWLLLGFFNDCVNQGLLCDYSNTLFEITIQTIVQCCEGVTSYNITNEY